MCLRCADLPTRQDEVCCRAPARSSAQELRPFAAWDQTDRHLGECDDSDSSATTGHVRATRDPLPMRIRERLQGPGR